MYILQSQRVAGTVGLFVHTHVYFLNFICRNCSSANRPCLPIKIASVYAYLIFDIQPLNDPVADFSNFQNKQTMKVFLQTPDKKIAYSEIMKKVATHFKE